MFIFIKTDSPYSDYEYMWEAVNSLPEGVLYHRINHGDEGIDHFFSDIPITDEEIGYYYDQ